VRIINPLSEDQSLLRTTLVPGLLGALRHNQSYQVMDLRLYEVGMIFLCREGQDLPEERPLVAGILSGQRARTAWHDKPAKVDFYDLKGVVEELLENLRVADPVFDHEALPAYLDPAASARVSAGGQVLGCLGRLRDSVAQAFDLRETPYVFELDLERLQAAGTGSPTFAALPRTPAVSRDLALVLGREVEAGRVSAYLRELKEEFLEEVTLFDAYEGRQLEPGLRGLAFRFLYRSVDRTLTDEEVNAVHERITQKVLSTFQARRRA
jgi:phenylalanyl-tRNA synthetase beta chain